MSIDCAQLTARIDAAFAPETKIRTASVRSAGGASSTVGTSTTTTLDSVRSRNFSANSNGCRACSRSERRRNCSGTTTVTKSDSPRGSRQTWSSTRLDRAAAPVERLEQRLAAREVEPARPDPGVACRAAGRGSRGDRPARFRARAREPRSVASSSESTTRSVRFARRRRRRDGRGAGAQPPRDAVVVPPHAEHRDDEEGDRDGHEPRAFAELRPDDDHRHEPGRRRADGVDRALPLPARRRGRAASSAPSPPARA